MSSWKEYFKGKFYLDEMIDSMIFCDDSMVTSECGDIEPAREDMKELVKALNGEPYSHATFDNPYYNGDGVVYYTDKTDEYMEYFNFFDTTGDELYYFPLEDVIGSREEQRKYTGLELQQKFLDMFNQHIRENKSIDFCCDCDNFATECGQDIGDGLVGCKVDILEV